MTARAIRFILATCLFSLIVPSAARAGPSAIPGREGWVFPAWELEAVADAQPAARLIGQASALLERHGMHLVVALTPAKIRIHPEHLPADLRPPDGFAPGMTRQVEALRQAGVEVVDLSIPLLAAKPRPQFHKTDSHWNIDAATRAARAVADRIRTRTWYGMLPAPSGPASPLSSPREVRHIGDLAALLPDVPGAGHYKTAENILVYREPSERMLLDDAEPASDVMVIGSSFAEPKWGFPQALGMALERPVGLLYSLGSYGYWYTLLDYLRSADFRAARPPVLVLQITESALPNLPDSAAWKRSLKHLPPGEWLRQLELALR